MESLLEIKAERIPLEHETELYIRDRAARLEDLSPGIIGCRVVVHAAPAHRRGYEVDIDLAMPEAHLMVNRQADRELREAISRAFAALELRLEEYARKNHRA